MIRPGRSKRIVLVLLLVLILPALFVSVVEISSFSTSEELIASIDRQQLDVILFSMNQYCWDVVNAWAGSINVMLLDRNSPDSLRTTVMQFCRARPSLRMILLADTSLSAAEAFSRSGMPDSQEVFLPGLRAHASRISQLIGYSRSDYRKIEPLRIKTPRGPALLLCFVTSQAAAGRQLAVMIPDEALFVREVLFPKLREVAGSEFILTVHRKGEALPVVTTSPENRTTAGQQKEIWLFPDYVLGIRQSGTTISDIIRGRMYRNIVLLLVVDGVLAAGIWLVYRNLKREMDLARMKSDFVSTVSHELRTPLSLIRMYSETLEMGRITEEGQRRKYYETILRESERLTRLVNNILNVARLEAGKKQYQRVPVSLAGIVSGVMDTFAVQLRTEGYRTEVSLGVPVPDILGDAETVAQAVMNVIDNAIKYGGDEKYLGVSIAARDDSVILTVEDHGRGIAANEREKIFEQFYRVSTGLVHDIKGSGLGLSLVRSIMDAHHGVVTVESAPGKGSIFRLEFPAAKELLT